jgi:hypothetical protein
VANTITIRRGSGAPSVLNYAEPAWDWYYSRLYVGNLFGVPVRVNRQSPIHGEIESPQAKAHVVVLKMDGAEDRLTLHARTGTGTCEVRLEANGTPIGPATLAVGNSSVATQSITGLSIVDGDTLTLAVTNVSAAEDLAFSLHFGR